jgi:glycosyltransferase involved in cell wall biosynthesis
MKVSVVIPAYNARQALRILLLTLGHCELDPEHSLEVVVVDDGSDDGTGDMVAALPARFDLTYVFVPRTATSGRAAARNVGIARATGDLVVMVDADQVVIPRFLAEHVRYHEIRTDLVVLGARSDLGAGSFDEELLAREFSFAAIPPISYEDPRQLVFARFSENVNQMATCWHYTFSCNVSVRREHLLAIGGFDEAFIGWGLEDTDLGYRLRQRGLAFAYNPAAAAYHQKLQNISAKQYAEWLRNLAYLVGKHGAPELAIQSILGAAVDPATQDEELWLESVTRFEYAARALAGRLPTNLTLELVEVDEGNLAETLKCLPDRAATADLLVIDNTDGAELAGVVQCTDTPRELLYFRRPTVEDRARLLARYQIGALL